MLCTHEKHQRIHSSAIRQHRFQDIATKHILLIYQIESVTNCNRLKLHAADGKLRMTDVADTEQLFRIIQSIPSPKAEPFKQWMAQVASQRIDQMQDPELSVDQAIMDYKRLGSAYTMSVMSAHDSLGT